MPYLRMDLPFQAPTNRNGPSTHPERFKYGFYGTAALSNRKSPWLVVILPYSWRATIFDDKKKIAAWWDGLSEAPPRSTR
ncbi:MAG: hypothetical protein AMXMBFR67_13290 [Nitrospira sp.]